MKVLLIDDEEDVREIASLSLADIGGMEVIAASSGPEGIEAAKRHAPDVVILDMMMPEVDGPATLLLLQQEETTREIPVIFLTARASAGDLERLKSLGAIGILVKPFDPVTLPDQVRQILAAE